jgi:[acyl-carrier-protein] S-malonyltransferase
MASAARAVENALSNVSIHPPAFPVWANVTGRPFVPDQIGGLLVDQIVEPVRFAQILEGMAEAGIDLFIHLGPGDVTAGLARRAVPGARTMTVSEVAAIGPAAESLGSIG